MTSRCVPASRWVAHPSARSVRPRVGVSLRSHTRLPLVTRSQGDILEGARRAGQAGSNFIANVNGVLTCNEVNNDFGEFKEAFCCDVMTAMYWSIGAW